MVKVENIKKSYGSLTVLRGVNLSISEGEIVSVVGPSGAGKSTLLHVIGTLDRPDEGNVFIHGSPVFSLPDEKLSDFRNRNIGFVFQFHHLLPEFSAVENVALPALIRGDAKREALKNAGELLDFMQLKDRLTHKPSELSGGEQQRVAVARALINHPQLVLADEPSGNLDSENARNLHRLFFDLRKEFGQTFIIVTKNEELANMSDTRVVIKDGAIENRQIM